MQDATPATKQYQCRHIFTDGHRCGSPCLRGEDLCYYHHTTRKPIASPKQRRSRRTTFDLPLPEDRSAIQASIGEVLQRIASNDIDPRRAGLLLYGLQIASLNLPKPQREAPPAPETVEEITTDPTLGTLAPRTELGAMQKPQSTIGKLLMSLREKEKEEKKEEEEEKNEAAIQPQETNILPTLNAEAELFVPTRHQTARRQTTPHKDGSKDRWKSSLKFPRNICSGYVEVAQLASFSRTGRFARRRHLVSPLLSFLCG